MPLAFSLSSLLQLPIIPPTDSGETANAGKKKFSKTCPKTCFIIDSIKMAPIDSHCVVKVHPVVSTAGLKRLKSFG